MTWARALFALVKALPTRISATASKASATAAETAAEQRSASAVRPCLRLAITHISDQPQGRYSCGLDLCLNPTRSLDVEGLQTAQHRETRSGRSRQGIDFV